MAKIVIVHGIGNQFAGEIELRAQWYSALCDGLLRARYSPLPKEEDCYCPFYGDVFRPQGKLSASAVEDVEETDPDDAQLLKAVWQAAADFDSQVPAPGEFAKTLAWAPRLVERALTALARSKYLADYFPLEFLGDLKQVSVYLKDRVKRQEILQRVLAHIDDNTRVVIGHSLGSVVAYEALCAHPAQVRSFLSVGSPLGIRNVVFEKLTPPPNAMGVGSWPGKVSKWTNIAAAGDIVAAQKTLHELFGDEVDDKTIDSGWDAHSSSRYLNTEPAGQAIAEALRE
jgi:alpha/beta hydrolase fold